MFIFSLVRFGLLSGHLLGNNCSRCEPHALFVFEFSYFRFGFKGWIWVLMASFFYALYYVTT